MSRIKNFRARKIDPAKPLLVDHGELQLEGAEDLRNVEDLLDDDEDVCIFILAYNDQSFLLTRITC